MATPPRATADSGFHSGFSASSFERRIASRLPARWMGWRLRLLVLAALAGCLATFVFIRWLADSHAIGASFETDARGAPTLVWSPRPDLAAFAGRRLAAVVGADGETVALDALATQRSARWEVDDARRRQSADEQRRLSDALAGAGATLVFADGGEAAVQALARGYAGIGLLAWPLIALALLLYLVGIVVVLVRPQARNLLYLAMALAQSANLGCIALVTLDGLGLPQGAASVEWLLRLGLELATGAACVHAFALHPRRLPWANAIGGAAWGLALAVFALAAAGRLPAPWWSVQAALLALGAAALATLAWSRRVEPNPFAAVAWRFSAVMEALLLLVTATAALASAQPWAARNLVGFGAAIWYLFFVGLLLIVPFLSRSRQVLREFAMLAGVSAITTSLDLLFVAAFSLGQFASLALAVFIGLAAYAGARQWVLERMVGSSVLTIERTFEQLYRVAREVQANPAHYTRLAEELLRKLFDPLEVLRVARGADAASVAGSGSTLLVPVRGGGADEAPARALSLALRFGQRGARMFTAEDARLADRVIQQLRRAIAYDRAVERGRAEERLRIAQDLHDDIGARLLTLMYKAQSPEMEDYARHTLQDLKTLTRGLAASEHRLSHAAAEWKGDLGQRLQAAQTELGWSIEYDRDLLLSVVQWSALTRVLRELVTNALYHGRATRVDVQMRLAGRELTLSVTDDGGGRSPESWAHGLGLGGVRKRVKLLGGEVRWRENQPRGIVCEVRAPEFARPA